MDSTKIFQRDFLRIVIQNLTRFLRKISLIEPILIEDKGLLNLFQRSLLSGLPWFANSVKVKVCVMHICVKVEIFLYKTQGTQGDVKQHLLKFI